MKLFEMLIYLNEFYYAFLKEYLPIKSFMTFNPIRVTQYYQDNVIDESCKIHLMHFISFSLMTT